MSNAKSSNATLKPAEWGVGALLKERSCCLLLVKFPSSKLQAPRAGPGGANSLGEGAWFACCVVLVSQPARFTTGLEIRNPGGARLFLDEICPAAIVKVPKIEKIAGKIWIMANILTASERPFLWPQKQLQSAAGSHRPRNLPLRDKTSRSILR